MRSRSTLVCSLLALSLVPLASRAAVAAPTTNSPPKIDLVIAVDVSGSMRGLIDATRLKMWDVVRLLGRAQPTPQIRVGLVSFGGKHHDAGAGYVRKEIDLTTDLDAVAARLFALQIEGSREYVARAVQISTRQMAWDQGAKSLKILFVAGNESAHQDPAVMLSAALAEARQRGIHVNTIYCGKPASTDAYAWRQAAALGGGEFAAIDHNESVVARTSPYDAELARLSTALSRTYVAYGDSGKRRHDNQLAQDEQARKDGLAIAAERAAAKASPTYSNLEWDAVDAYEKRGRIVGVPADQEALVRGKLAERQKLRALIGALASTREQWLRGADRGGAGEVANPYSGSPAAGTATATASTTRAPATATPVAVAAAPSVVSQPAPAPSSEPATMASLHADPATLDSLRARRGPASTAPAKPAPKAKPTMRMDDAFSGAVERTATKNGFAF